ncbi:MAG: hypothetical protein IT385_25305 [Deltaproteobacteria bacterium]|nr:hypothetical protein [Deltaproteobacteria bacterium]
MRGIVVLLLVVGGGCGTGHGVPDGQPRPTRGVDLPPLFAALFEEGRSFDYAYVASADAASGDDPGMSPTHVRCRIARVVELGTARASEILCEHADASMPPDEPTPTFVGPWVGDARGLWLAGFMPESEADLALITEGAPLFDPAPQARTWTEDVDEGTYQNEHAIRRDGDGWCHEVVEDEWFGGSSRICVEAGEGVVLAEHHPGRSPEGMDTAPHETFRLRRR